MSTLDEKLREIADSYMTSGTQRFMSENCVVDALREAAEIGAREQRENVPHLAQVSDGIVLWVIATEEASGDHKDWNCALLGGRCAPLVTGGGRAA